MSRERPGGRFVLLMAQTVAPETGGTGTFTALEPYNCKADSSGLLSTQTVCAEEAGQESTRERSHDAVTFKRCR